MSGGRPEKRHLERLAYGDLEAMIGHSASMLRHTAASELLRSPAVAAVSAAIS